MADEIVVLTGAAGCIGYHTLRLLISHEHSVREIRCLDLVEPSEEIRSKIQDEIEIRKLKTPNPKQAPKVDWFKGDIRDINLVERLLKQANCIIHCAAKIDVWTHTDQQDLNELKSINVDGTENLLKSAQRLGVSKFIHVSSFETYIGFDTIYYATENTLPEIKWFLFGASGSTKKDAENKVKQYSNVKLDRPVSRGHDQLLTVIIRFSTVYGEFDRHYVSKIIELAGFFGGKLRRMSNVWIKHQSIYATNAAWALIKAKRRLDEDFSISGEEFHITDDTPIEDPFDFVEPFLESKGMRVTKNSYPFIPILLLVWLFFAFMRFVRLVDVFGLFTERKGRFKETLDQDNCTSGLSAKKFTNSAGQPRRHWYNYVMPQTLCYMCNSSFLNRTKASLRLDYEPLINPDEAKLRSLEWYRGINI